MAQDGEKVEAEAPKHRQTIGWEGTVLAATYRVLRRLGKGAMGEVYEAEHIRLGKRVAVKFMRAEVADDRRAVKRFGREVRALAAVMSENVVDVFDCGEVDGEIPFIVMERLQGEDLKSLLAREGALDARRAVRLALDACAGLSAVHAAGLVHRDLKPANLFLTSSKARGELCKILDFGVAKVHASEATLQDSFVGTVRYMAPEQLADGSSVRATTDVYAVGAILFECLTGRPARAAETPQELMFDVLNRDPPLASDVRPELPEGLPEIVACAMSRDAADRYQSAAELASALKPFAELDASSGDDTTLDGSRHEQVLSALARRRSVRGPAMLTLALAFAVGIASGVVLTALVRHSPAPTAVEAPKHSPPKPITSQAPRTPPAVEPRQVEVERTPTRTAAVENPPKLVPNASSSRPKPKPPTESPLKKESPRAQSPVVLDVQNPYDE